MPGSHCELGAAEGECLHLGKGTFNLSVPAPRGRCRANKEHVCDPGEEVNGDTKEAAVTKPACSWPLGSLSWGRLQFSKAPHGVLREVDIVI